ncbi:hypothetical protein AB0F42_26020 [Streptomyces buecherae]
MVAFAVLRLPTWLRAADAVSLASFLTPVLLCLVGLSRRSYLRVTGFRRT